MMMLWFDFCFLIKCNYFCLFEKEIKWYWMTKCSLNLSSQLDIDLVSIIKPNYLCIVSVPACTVIYFKCKWEIIFNFRSVHITNSIEIKRHTFIISSIVRLSWAWQWTISGKAIDEWIMYNNLDERKQTINWIKAFNLQVNRCVVG